MTVLFIEGSNSIDSYIQMFIDKLKSEGHTVRTVLNCYNNKRGLINALKKEIDVIAVFTTYVYQSKFASIFAMVDLLVKPVELWSLNDTYRMAAILPGNVREKVTLYDVNPVAYVDSWDFCEWKTLHNTTSTTHS